MFDTHCHLNFHAFDESLEEVISQATSSGIEYIVIPGTDIMSSQKAIKIAEKHQKIFAAVGIHPHHVLEIRNSKFETPNEELMINNQIKTIEKLLQNTNVVAVGEVGMDRHVYEKTKYEDNSVDEDYINLQKIFLIEQIKLAIKYKKSLILHNREAKQDLIPIIKDYWNESLRGCSVFHCCEADEELLDFAKEHGMYIGIDGDITWSKKKQRFIKEVPLEMLVLETDSPFLTPEPIRETNPQNNPSNLRIICQKVAGIKGVNFEEIAQRTEENGKKLFRL